MWSLPLSVFSQLRSQAVAAHCGAIVLMLIEYSARSFHGCLLSHFIMVLYQNVHFFPPSLFQNQIWCCDGGYLVHWSTQLRQCMV